MTCHSLRFLLPALVLVLPAAAQDPELQLDVTSGSLIVRGYPTLNKTSDSTLQAKLPSPTYLARYDAGVQVTKRCELKKDWRIELLNSGTKYAGVAINESDLTVTRYKGTAFGGGQPDQDGYIAWKLTGYVAGYEFHVYDDGNTERCKDELGNSFPRTYLRISKDAKETADRKDYSIEGGPDDSPIPIIGNSLKLLFPKGTKLTKCEPKTESTAATLEGVVKALSFERFHNITGMSPDPYVVLDSISDWRIIVYPQQLEITPGWSGTLKFRAPSTNPFQCGNDGEGDYLSVPGDVKPQQFVIDWSPGWFQTRRYLPVSCGSCSLNLIVRKKK